MMQRGTVLNVTSYHMNLKATPWISKRNTMFVTGEEMIQAQL
jgi:hypothetical protein